MKTAIFCIWLICATILLDIILDMVSAKNTIENIMGLAILLLAVLGSVYTKCLTKITKLWKKD